MRQPLIAGALATTLLFSGCSPAGGGAPLDDAPRPVQKTGLSRPAPQPGPDATATAPPEYQITRIERQDEAAPDDPDGEG